MSSLFANVFRLFMMAFLFLPLCQHICSEDRPLSVCEALSSPMKLNDKIIAVRGVQVATDEGVWLKGVNCDPITTKGYTWPAAIWLDMSKDRLDSANFDFAQLSADIVKVNREMARLPIASK